MQLTTVVRRAAAFTKDGDLFLHRRSKRWYKSRSEQNKYIVEKRYSLAENKSQKSVDIRKPPIQLLRTSL